MEISYTAPDFVQSVINRLGRTEDLRFSPSNKRLAVSEFSNNRIALFDIEIILSNGNKVVSLKNVMEIASDKLNHPHGLDFIDENNIVIANRDASVIIFQIPVNNSGKLFELRPLEIFGEFEHVNTPGSVAVLGPSKNPFELFVCNNYSNTVTRHLIELNNGFSVRKNHVLLTRWMDIPDGISLSANGRWMAISNHSTHCVLLYKDVHALDASAEPDGFLGCVRYPHGLRFCSGDNAILVADAGSPFVHVYVAGPDEWVGVRTPRFSLKAITDEEFLSGRHNPQEGGPKGIDVTRDMSLLVTTNECRPLAFFDLQAVLQQASHASLQG